MEGLGWVLPKAKRKFVVHPRFIRSYFFVALLSNYHPRWTYRLYYTIYTSEFAVTNQRIVFKTGWLNINLVEIKHKAVEAVIIEQPTIGRIFGYGTIRIIGSGGTMETYRNIQHPLEFRKKCWRQD